MLTIMRSKSLDLSVSVGFSRLDSNRLILLSVGAGSMLIFSIVSISARNIHNITPYKTK